MKLNLGSGNKHVPGFLGVDRRKFDGVDIVTDLDALWPWSDASVSEIHMSHLLEHFDGRRRVHIFNEMYRVLVPSGKATVITPHWCSNLAYGDFTHAWPPVSEMLYLYLRKDWRIINAPDNDAQWNPDGYTCNFSATLAYRLRKDLAARNQVDKQFSILNYKEAALELIATLVRLT